MSENCVDENIMDEIVPKFSLNIKDNMNKELRFSICLVNWKFLCMV